MYLLSYLKAAGLNFGSVHKQGASRRFLDVCDVELEGLSAVILAGGHAGQSPPVPQLTTRFRIEGRCV